MTHQNTSRRNFLKASAALGFASLAFPGWAGAGELALINKAGRQRMLSQRIVKFYVQIGRGLVPADSRAGLADCIRLFDNQLSELKSNSKTPAVATSLSEMERAWGAARKLALLPPSQANASQLNLLCDSVLAAAQQTTLDFQEALGLSQGKLVNLAGRQRMLSQRLAKLYLLKGWGLGGVDTDKVIASARNEFTAALATLEKAPENNRAIRQELELARQQWFFFDQALNQPATDVTASTNVATASDRILQSLDQVVTQYERLLG